jgi:hypothetical protein
VERGGDNSSGVRLAQVFSIGFAGRVSAGEEAGCRAAVLQWLEREKAVAGRTLYAVVMAGGVDDMVWPECCIELGIATQVLLPAGVEELRSKFNAAGWARMEEVMRGAVGVEVVAGEGSWVDRECECGVEMVRQSELVVAAGESEVVEFARAMGRAVVRVEARMDGGDFQRDAELEFLNQLDDVGVQARDDSAAAMARAWQSKLSANAGLVAPKVRRLAAVPIVCTALAAVVAGGATHMQMKVVWTAAGTVLGLAAALLPAALRLGKRQALWVRLRTAAEVTRSVRALWDAPMRYELVGPDLLPELEGMVLSLNLLKARAGKRAGGDVEAFKKRYREERVLDQMRYFSGQARQAAARGRRYRLVSKVCILAAILISVTMVMIRFLLKMSEGPWEALLTSALFQGATVAGALLVVNDCDRRERRYEELHQSLRAMDVELVAFRTWALAGRAVNKIERTLLVELIEWRSLLQNRQMPRN